MTAVPPPSRRRGRAADAAAVGARSALLALAAAGASLVIGRSSGGPTFGFGGPELAPIVLTEIRLPRTLLALLVGGTLGLCGAALQGLLRNPLAEPGLLGASSGAAFGAVLVFYFGLAGADSLCCRPAPSRARSPRSRRSTRSPAGAATSSRSCSRASRSTRSRRRSRRSR